MPIQFFLIFFYNAGKCSFLGYRVPELNQQFGIACGQRHAFGFNAFPILALTIGLFLTLNIFTYQLHNLYPVFDFVKQVNP